MRTHALPLQSAIATLVDMVHNRLQQYQQLKTMLPKFDGQAKGIDVDEELGKFFEGCEVSNVGIMLWYYESPRYFGDVEASKYIDVPVKLFKRGS
jgi:hypothetical protein